MPRIPAALFLVFNRPAQTARVFAALRKARPARLLVVADGPRTGRPGEAERCRETRALIKADWPCKVQRLYADENMGCRRRVSSGLDWAFRQVPEAVVLEDDCLPSPSFFRFCAQMLARYRRDERVMAVSGSSYFPSSLEPRASYYFTRYPHIWGWASWRRAWKHYDADMAAWPAWRDAGGLQRRFPSWLERRYWSLKLDRVSRGEIDTWDYQWALATWMKEGLCAVPARNLVQNLGLEGEGTHVVETPAAFKQAAESLDFPLIHPSAVRTDEAVEAKTWAQNFRPQLWPWLRRKLRATAGKR
jgi:hypothetical protein